MSYIFTESHTRYQETIYIIQDIINIHKVIYIVQDVIYIHEKSYKKLESNNVIPSLFYGGKGIFVIEN